MTPKYKPLVFNYLRVSSVLQNTERQLLDVPCDREFIDKASGKDTNRPAFQEMMAQLRQGDQVNCHSLDRVGRNTADILKIVQDIKDKGCSIKFHKENLVFDGTKADLYSDLMLTILSAFSQFERNIILERQREGIVLAKQKGLYKGRQPKINNEQIEMIKADFDSGMKKTEIAGKYGITRSYVYQVVKAAA